MTDDELDAIVERVIQESLAINPGCCGDDRWRGHLCQYHDGFMDGAEAALRALS